MRYKICFRTALYTTEINRGEYKETKFFRQKKWAMHELIFLLAAVFNIFRSSDIGKD